MKLSLSLVIALLCPVLWAGTLREGFQDGDIGGWLVRGDWEINAEEGYAVVDVDTGGGFGLAYLLIGNEDWADCIVTARVMPELIKGIGTMAIATHSELVAGEFQGEFWGLRTDLCWAGHRNHPTYDNLLFLELGNCPLQQWYTLRVVAKDKKFDFWINETYVGHASAPAVRSGGLIGVGFEEIRARVDEITISVPDIPCDQLQEANVEYVCARALANPAEGEAPLTVTFDGSGSEVDPLSSLAGCRWDFGDGRTATETVCQNTYALPGRYIVDLTAITDKGLEDTTTTSVLVRLASGDVSPWTSVDLGKPAFPGGARYEGEDLVICGGGAGAYNVPADEGQILWQELQGDGVLTAWISEVPSAAAGGIVGVFFRDGLEQSAACAGTALYCLPTNPRLKRFVAIHRAAGGQNSTVVRGADAWTPNTWVRIERRGNAFRSLYSTDGTQWEEIESAELDLPERAVAAIMVTAGVHHQEYDFTLAKMNARLRGPGVPFRRGDANDDAMLNIADPIFMLTYLFAGGEMWCLDAADANDDGKLDIADPIALLAFLFAAGPPPEPPYPDCDIDPTEDEIACATFKSCP